MCNIKKNQGCAHTNWSMNETDKDKEIFVWVVWKVENVFVFAGYKAHILTHMYDVHLKNFII